MQAWISSELTLQAPPGTIPNVGRPTKQLSPTAYEEAFRRRVRAARALITEAPKEFARMIGVPADTWYRYETRTMLPHHLIPRFCQITGVTVDYLMSGPRPGQSSHTGIQASDNPNEN